MIFIFEKIFVRVFVYKSWKIGIEKRKKCHLWIQKITRYAYYCNDVSIFFSDKLHRSSLTRPPPSNIPNTHHDGSSRHNLRLVTPFKNYVNGEWSSTWRSSSSSQQGDEFAPSSSPFGKTYLRVFLKKKIWVGRENLVVPACVSC